MADRFEGAIPTASATSLQHSLLLLSLILKTKRRNQREKKKRTDKIHKVIGNGVGRDDD